MIHISEKESFGLAVYEAAAMGLDLIINPIEGLTDLKNNIIFFEAGNTVNSVIRALINYENSYRNKRDIRRSNNAYYIQKFTMNRRNDNLLKFHQNAWD